MKRSFCQIIKHFYSYGILITWNNIRNTFMKDNEITAKQLGPTFNNLKRRISIVPSLQLSRNMKMMCQCHVIELKPDFFILFSNVSLFLVLIFRFNRLLCNTNRIVIMFNKSTWVQFGLMFSQILMLYIKKIILFGRVKININCLSDYCQFFSYTNYRWR